MNKNCSTTSDTFLEPGSLWTIFKTEKRWYLCGGTFAFFLASVLWSGWPEGLLPNLAYPYSYDGDGLGYSWQIQRVIEGWIFNNPRNGYPFGSNFMDYPGSDSGTLLLLKIIGMMSGSFYAAFNLYFLLTFSLVCVATYVVLRSFDLSKPLSLAGGLIYAFLPFHFLRIDHYFFVSYFVAPLFFYAAIKIYTLNGQNFLRDFTFRKSLAYLAIFIGLASFGVYYALFGTILIGTVVLMSVFRQGGYRNALIGCLAVLAVSFGVLVNTAPNIVYKKVHGANSQIIHRNSAEAEHYGFKLAQLLLPRPGHRIDMLANYAEKYNKNTPLVNENAMSSLGLIGSLGLCAIALLLLRAGSGARANSTLILLSALTCVLLLFGTIGGLGSLFSLLISSSIRGWNRISVFIGFGAIAILLLLIGHSLQLFRKTRGYSALLWLCAIALSTVAIYDQTAKTCRSCNDNVRRAFEADRDFVAAIEAAVPKGSAIYQLPYIAFPEGVPFFKIGSYDMLTGFLHSKALKWNLAGMKDREGDVFYKTLSNEPLNHQTKIIKVLGFGGIYLDKRGFADNGEKIENHLSDLLGKKPTLISSDGNKVFFTLPESNLGLSQLTAKQIMQLAGYQSVEHQRSTFSEPIIFSKVQLPNYVEHVKGLSEAEDWGRWSDATQSPSVSIKLNQSLPNEFNLVIGAKTYVADPNQRLRIEIGSHFFEPKIGTDFSKITIPVNLKGAPVDKIVLTPQITASPTSLGLGSDNRELGIGLASLQIEPATIGSFKQ